MEDNNDETSVSVQDGNHSVSHRNIDQAGADHPMGNEPKKFTGDMRALIRRVADDLYSSWEATVREYLANAETACLRVQEYAETGESDMFDGDLIVPENYQPKIEVTWRKNEDKLVIQDNGIGMSADVVDQVFRQIGRSTNRDAGQYSGQFGQGVLSFVKFTGLDNAMIMTSHSRLNDDNASYYVTLAGVEPIRGSLDDDEYGTKFTMTQDGDYDVREAVSKYAEWMRVPVKYEEYGDDGRLEFEEDYGDKSLIDDYDDDRACFKVEEPGAFVAYSTPVAESRTLLLSMEIDRTDGSTPSPYAAPFPFDVRLLDESGKVVESSNGNDGLMPAPESDYEQMLLDAREGYIGESVLNPNDVVAQAVVAGPNEGQMAVADEDLSGRPLPSRYDYVAKSELQPADEPGERRVIFGTDSHEGRTVVSDDEWDEMDEGRAANYVPETELEPYNLDTGEGDLCLPEPTSDRDRLQEHETFWRWLSQQFGQSFDNTLQQIHEEVKSADDPLKEILELDREELAVMVKDVE